MFLVFLRYCFLRLKLYIFCLHVGYILCSILFYIFFNSFFVSFNAFDCASDWFWAFSNDIR